MVAESDIGLSARQEQAIIALLNEATVARAAKASEVPERTLYNWLEEPAFSKEYRKRRREAYGQAIALTQRYAGLAVNTLAKIMNDERVPAHSRVTAAATLLKFGREGIELDDLAARITALENPAPGDRRVAVNRLPPFVYPPEARSDDAGPGGAK